MLKTNQKMFLALMYWYAMEHAQGKALEEVSMHPMKWDAGQISQFPLWKKMKKLPKKNDISQILKHLKEERLMIHPDAVYLSRDGVQLGEEVFQSFLAKYSAKTEKPQQVTCSEVIIERVVPNTQEEKTQEMIPTTHVEQPPSGNATMEPGVLWYLFSKYAVFLEALLPFLNRSFIERMSCASQDGLFSPTEGDRLTVDIMKGGRFLTKDLHFTSLLEAIYKLLECIDQYFDDTDLKEIDGDLFADICKSQELRGTIYDREYVILIALVHMYLLDQKVHPSDTSDALTRWSMYALDLVRGTSLAQLKAKVDSNSLSHFKKAAKKAQIYDGRSTCVWPISSHKFIGQFDFTGINFAEVHSFLSRSELPVPKVGSMKSQQALAVECNAEDPLYPAWLYSGACAQFHKEVEGIKAGRTHMLSSLEGISLLQGVSNERLLGVLGGKLSIPLGEGKWARHMLAPQEGDYAFPSLTEFKSDKECMVIYEKFIHACKELEELYDALMHQVGVPAKELQSTIYKLLKS